MSNKRQRVIAYVNKKLPTDLNKYNVDYANPTFFSSASEVYDYYIAGGSAKENAKIRESFSLYAPNVKPMTPEMLSGSATSDSDATPVASHSSSENVAPAASDEASAMVAEPVVDNASSVAPKATVPADYEQLEWAEMRILASQFIEGRFNKQDALEALAKAYAAQQG